MQGELGKLVEKAENAIKEKRGKTQPYEVSLSRGAFEELVQLYDRLAGARSGGDRLTPPKRIPGVGTFVWCSITAEAVVALIAELAGDQSHA